MSGLYNFCFKVLEIVKGDVWARTGAGIFVASLGSGLSVTFPEFTAAYMGFSFSFGQSGPLLGQIASFVGAFFGLSLVGHRYLANMRRPPMLFYASSLTNMDDVAPFYALPPIVRVFAQERKLKNIDTYSLEQVVENYKFNKQLIMDRVEHSGTPKVYLAALGSFPYLFLIGSLFRNAHCSVQVLDYKRNASGGSKWYRLDSVTSDKIHHVVKYQPEVSWRDAIDRLISSDTQEIGLALSYTFDINTSELPSGLRDSTVIFECSKGKGHDLLCNDALQEQLLNEISLALNMMVKSSKRVHLFVSAQGSMCVNIGKCYQDNAHGNIVVHNYNNELKTYDWGLSYEKGSILT